jgi:hypothetical protein
MVLILFILYKRYHYLLFYVLLKNISHIWRCHHYRWIRAVKFRSMPLSREGYLSSHSCCDTRPRFFRSHPNAHPAFSRLLRHTRRCWGSILTRILTGRHYKSNFFLSSNRNKVYLQLICLTIKKNLITGAVCASGSGMFLVLKLHKTWR